MKLETMKTERKMLIFYELYQCGGSGSGLAWIRTDFGRLDPIPEWQK
jgi:hypothetical protein